MIADLTLTVPDFWLGFLAGVATVILALIIAAVVISSSKP